jgi:pimeloyl-ACP methyl ester carboxylesterase
VLVNGGQAGDVPGTWSATLEWLVRRLAPLLPGLAFAEVRFRLKSWKRLDMCAEDALATLELVLSHGARKCALVGFSMGGAVAIKAAGHERVASVIGLAPWIPDRLDLTPLAGRRFAVIHGALDRFLPGIPGVSPGNSMRGYRRARELGVLDAEYTLIPGGLHGVAVHAPWGLTPLPRARRWAELIELELRRFQEAA